ncbi:MAG: PilZ domain-containing protein [Alphaproteobacteria bacterium]
MSESEKRNEALIERARKERRRFRRVRLAISGRLYIPATQEEAVCAVEDISPGGVSVTCELKQEPQGNIVIYLDGLGRFEGAIARRTPSGFAVAFASSLQKRDRLADQLTLRLNRHLVGESHLRNYERAPAAAGSHTVFTRASGEQIRCDVLDFSLTGISVRTELRPPVGEHILIGHRAGRVARHHSEGIGIEFLGLLFPNTSLFERPSAAQQPQPAQSAPLSAAGGAR